MRLHFFKVGPSVLESIAINKCENIINTLSFRLLEAERNTTFKRYICNLELAASWFEQVEVMNYLLKQNGLNLDQQDIEGKTVMHYACHTNYNNESTSEGKTRAELLIQKPISYELKVNILNISYFLGNRTILMKELSLNLQINKPKNKLTTKKYPNVCSKRK
jgi:ankyrin repeat protein